MTYQNITNLRNVTPEIFNLLVCVKCSTRPPLAPYYSTEHYLRLKFALRFTRILIPDTSQCFGYTQKWNLRIFHFYYFDIFWYPKFENGSCFLLLFMNDLESPLCMRSLNTHRMRKNYLSIIDISKYHKLTKYDSRNLQLVSSCQSLN